MAGFLTDWPTVKAANKQGLNRDTGDAISMLISHSEIVTDSPGWEDRDQNK